MAQHLLFYDGQCGLCDHAVQFVLKHDKQEQFIFAPLQGSTAKKFLSHLPKEMKTADSLILIENYQTESPRFFIMGKGAFRICWLLGGWWKLLGILSWLPSIFYDWGYRFVARHRHQWFTLQCTIPTPGNRHRFLP